MTSTMVSEGSQRTERAWGSTLFGKPISESSRLIPESIMSSISSCVGAYSVTAGYARERRLAVLSSLGPRVATRAGAHVCLESQRTTAGRARCQQVQVQVQIQVQVQVPAPEYP